MTALQVALPWRPQAAIPQYPQELALKSPKIGFGFVKNRDVLRGEPVL
jgi:hypothetical protein